MFSFKTSTLLLSNSFIVTNLKIKLVCTQSSPIEYFLTAIHVLLISEVSLLWTFWASNKKFISTCQIFGSPSQILINLHFGSQSQPFISHEVAQFFSNRLPSIEQVTIRNNSSSEPITIGNLMNLVVKYFWIFQFCVFREKTHLKA